MFWCVPWALSKLTEIPYNDLIKDIQKDLGNQPIKGVYMGIAIKILNERGFWTERKNDGFPLSVMGKTKGTFLVEIQNHALVIKDGILYDNNYQKGTDKHFYRMKVLRCWEVGKIPEQNAKTS